MTSVYHNRQSGRRALKQWLLGGAIISLVAALAIGSGCSGGDSGQPPADDDARGSIGPAGGTVVHDSGAGVEIPAGALAATTEIVVSTTTTGMPAIPSGLEANGSAFAMLPHGTAFMTPATVSIPFTAALVPDGATPRLFKAEPGGSFAEIPATVSGGKLVAQVTGFSFFQALGDTQGPLPTQEIVVTWEYAANGTCSVPGDCGVGGFGQWTVPADVYSATFELYGASGGGLGGAGTGHGLGGKTTATLTVIPGEVLQIRLGAPGNTRAAYNGGGTGGSGSAGTYSDTSGTVIPTPGSAGGGATDVRRGTLILQDVPGAAGRLAVAGGGGGDGGIAVLTLSPGMPSTYYEILVPGAPGGLGGGLVGGTGGSGLSSAGVDWDFTSASGGTGGSTLAPGLAGSSSYDNRWDPPTQSGLPNNGDAYYGGGRGGAGGIINGFPWGSGGGGGGGGWMPGGGGGSTWYAVDQNGAGGGGGSSYGPYGSEFFQGVHVGGGRAVITFTPSPGLAPTITTVVSSDTPSTPGQSVTFTANVTMKPPATGQVTGSVRFEVDGMLIGSGPVVLVNGHATSAAITTMSPGTHQVLATYLGSSGVAPSADDLAQVVGP
jgi:hypothetical protein